MEILLIPAAVAATLLALVLVIGFSKGTRRDPLRLPREEEWADDADAVVRALTPDRPSPIDRDAPVLDIEPRDVASDRPKAIEAPPASSDHGTPAPSAAGSRGRP